MRKRIIFYYPCHFNRSENGTNYFFDPLIEVCNKNKINYLLIEEPAIGTNYQHNPAAKKFDVFFYIIILLRKIIPLIFFKHFEYREHFIGKIINIISLGYFRGKVIITISNSLGGVLRGINNHSRIFDYQHGIIPSIQPGYFSNSLASDTIRLNNKEVLVYGSGFKNIFLKVDSGYFKDRVHVIGKNYNVGSVTKLGRNILVSLQIIEGEKKHKAWFEDQVNLLYEQFSLCDKYKFCNDRKVFIKHHPRSSQKYDLSKLLKFPFVKIFDGSEEANNVALHLTFFSTSAFDYAQKGIPTLFLYSQNIPEGEGIFINEFQYPFNHYKTIIDWLNVLKNEDEKKKIQSSIKEWYSKYYSPFDEEAFIDILKNEA